MIGYTVKIINLGSAFKNELGVIEKIQYNLSEFYHIRLFSTENGRSITLPFLIEEFEIIYKGNLSVVL